MFEKRNEVVTPCFKTKSPEAVRFLLHKCEAVWLVLFGQVPSLALYAEGEENTEK